jgi:hypothetical protein
MATKFDHETDVNHTLSGLSGLTRAYLARPGPAREAGDRPGPGCPGLLQSRRQFQDLKTQNLAHNL